MVIQTLTLQNFRNYHSACFSFSPDNNVIFGPNAVGKTNILEAVYLLATSRSHRLAKDHHMIRFQEEFGAVGSEFTGNGRKNTEKILLFRDKKKQITINKVPVTRLSEMMGVFNAVIFCPEDLKIIKGSPKDRRRMVDLAICQLKSGYVAAISDYNRILEQRNILLKEEPESKMLWVWTRKLAECGAAASIYRNSYLIKLSQLVREIQQEIAGEEAEIHYVSGIGLTEFSEKEELINQFEQALNQNLERDKRFKTTTCGIHRDDFRILINGMDAKLYASQGQQRTLAISAKLAEVRMVEETAGQSPVLLLDDVLSELDRSRQEYILGKIKGMQVILTSTEAEIFDSVPNLNKIKL